MALIERDAGYARTLGVARLLGQGLVVQLAIERGESNETANRSLVELSASFPKSLPEISDTEAVVFLNAVGKALEQYASRGEREADALDRALQVYDRQIVEQAEVAGFGDDIAKIVAALGLSAALLLGVAKTSAHVPLPDGGFADVVTGVPQGLQPLLDLVGKALTLSPTETPRPRLGTTEPGTPDGDSIAPGQSVPKARAMAPARSARPQIKQMTYAEALQRRDDVLAEINRGRLLNFLTPEQKELFASQQTRAFTDIWNARVPENRPFSFTAGVFLVTSAHEGDNRPRFRVGLRVQSLKRLTVRTLLRAANEIDERFPEEVSVRWTTPVVHLVTNPHLGTMRWEVSAKDRIALGAPVNVAGGAVGSWTIVLRDRNTGEARGLTAGHPIFDDDGRAKIGHGVYCPPQPRDADNRYHYGTVAMLETFAPFNPLAVSDQGHLQDYALVRLAPGRVPLDDDKRRAGTRLHSGGVARMQRVREERPRMVKVAAKTREAVGRFTTSDVRAEIINPMTGLTVVGDGMIEIEIDRPFEPAPGDSGALVCVDDGNAVEPCALVVAAARKGTVRAEHSRTRAILYALPLDQICARNSLEIW